MVNIDIPDFDLKSYVGIDTSGGYRPSAMSQAYLERLFDYFRNAVRLYGTDEERRTI